MKGRRPGGLGGFTLVELMLSVFLLAIVMALIYGVVVSTVEAAHRVEEINQASEIGPAILGQVREDLESAFLPWKEGEWFVSISKNASSGNRDRIDFIGARMAYGARTGDDPAFHSVNELGYQVQDGRPGSDPSLGILYRRLDYFIDAEPLRGGHLIEMYDRVRHFRLEFYNGDTWMPDWNSKREQNRLPRAVRIELKIVVTEQGQPVEKFYSSIVTFVPTAPPQPGAPPGGAPPPPGGTPPAAPPGGPQAPAPPGR